jgi:hypothetical protein
VSKKNRPASDLPGFGLESPAGPESSAEPERLPGASRQHRFLDFVAEFDQEAGFTVGEYPLERIAPDFYQSRGGVLPRSLAFDVLVGKIPHVEALARWENSLVAATPQHQQYLDLLSLKESIRTNGLLHPIHIYKDPHLDSYTILAGERRYWAFWLLRIETGKYSRIPAVIHAEPARFLQIAENEEIAPLSTIGRARQVALGYLDLLNIRPPGHLPQGDAEYWAFYRQALLGPEALLGQKRLPDHFWPQLEARLGMHRVSILGFLDLLNLPDESLSQADQWFLNQNQLTAVLAAPRDVHNQIVGLIAQRGLAGPEIKRLARLAQMPGRSAFNSALRQLAASTDETAAASKARRRQRPPLEVHIGKVFNSFHGLRKFSGGDYRSFARLVASNHPEEASQLAGELEAAALAIRAELEALGYQLPVSKGRTAGSRGA